MEQTLSPMELAEQIQFQASLLRLVYHGSVDGGARAENSAVEIEEMLPR